MLGHSKTILVLLGGWLFLGDVITAKQAGGMAIAVAGMVAYGIASSQCAPSTLNPRYLPRSCQAPEAVRHPRVGRAPLLTRGNG